MGKKWRVLAVVLAVLVGALAGFGLDYISYSRTDHPVTLFEGAPLLSEAVDYSQLTINCWLEYDGERNAYRYTVIGEDPQMYLYREKEPFAVIELAFAEPVESAFRLQVYPADENGGLSEGTSVVREVAAGSESLSLELPEGPYEMLRFDLDGNAWIRQIRTGHFRTEQLPYTPDWGGILPVFVSAAVLAGVLLLGLVSRKRPEDRGALSLQSVRDALHHKARLLYHVLAVVYLFGSFLTILYWTGDLWTPMSTLGDRICEVVRYAMLLLVLEQLTRKPLHALLTIAVVAVGWVAFNNSGVYRLVDFLIFFMLSDLADEKVMPRMVLTAFAVMLPVLALLMHMGYVNPLVVNFTYRPGHALGFGHPNTTGAVVLTVIILVYLVFLKKHSWIMTVICLGGAAFAWFVPASRTVLVLLAIMPLALFLVRWIGQTKAKKILYLAPLVPWILFAISYGITLYVMKTSGNNILASADGNMMARFNFTARAIRDYGYSLFGKYIPDAIILDNAYLNVMMRYGFVSLGIVLCLFSYTLFQTVKKERYEYTVLLLIYMVYGIMERCPVHLFNHFIPFVILGVVSDPGYRKPMVRLPFSWKRRAAWSLGIAAACVLVCTVVQVPGHIGMAAGGRGYGNTAVTGFIDGSAEQSQTLTVNKKMEGFRVLAATYGTKPAGEYAMTLYDEAGNALETAAVSGADIYDSVFIEAFFGKSYGPGKYRVSFYPVSAPGDCLALWQNDWDPYSGGSALVNGMETGCDWVFDIFETTYSWQWILWVLVGMLGCYLIFCVWVCAGWRKPRGETIPA